MPATETVIAAVSLWPAEPPTLRVLEASARLIVPLSSRPGAVSRSKPPGTVVSRGEPLVESTVESSHIALAPVDGTLGEARQVLLTNGRVVPAVELIASQTGVDGPQKEFATNSPPTESAKSGGGPALLVQWIERLRFAGVWADRHASPDLIAQLNYVVSHPIEMILCSTLDTDPGARLNSALAAQNAKEVVAGVTLLARLAGARDVVIAV
jgi:Na+-translocating ferredoxin:NAD+ oxidoreductase RnfC subunit